MDLMAKLRAVIESTAAAIEPGAAAARAAGEALVDYVTDLAPTLSENDQRSLQQSLPALLSKMNRDVDQAIADLGGTGR